MDDDYADSFDDDKLLEKLAENLDDYFHLLIAKYGKIIFVVTRNMLDNPQDAEEVTADTFEKAYKALPSMIYKKRKITFRPWLFKIAKNSCINHMKHESGLKQLPPSVSLDVQDVREYVEGTRYGQDSSAEEEAIQRENNTELYCLLGLLPERQREIIILYYIGGLSDLEIASVLKRKRDIIPRPDAIKKARQRAFKTLQEMVADKKSDDHMAEAFCNEYFLSRKKENTWNKETTI